MLEINVRIVVDNQTPTEREVAILAALSLGGLPVNDAPVEEPKPRAKPGPKPRPKPEPEPVKEEPANDVSRTVSEEDKSEAAVKVASEMIGSGKKDALRALLEELGVKRVSDLSGDTLNSFLLKSA